jgi:hypothetical protein
MLARRWTSAPLDASAPGALLGAEAAAAARPFLALWLEASLRMAEGGWVDSRFLAMQVVLGTFGDGYAIASYPGPRSELPALVLPDLKRLEGFALANGVAALCEEHGVALPLTRGSERAPAFAGRDAAIRSLAASTALEGLIVATLEGREAPKESDTWADSDTRARLASWIVGYTNTIEGISSADDPASLETFRQQTRPVVVKELAFLRRDLSRWVDGGASHEAVAAAGLLVQLLRAIFLVTTVADAKDASCLPLPTIALVNRWVDALGIRAWLDSPGTG